MLILLLAGARCAIHAGKKGEIDSVKILDDLLREHGLPVAQCVADLKGRGFDSNVHRVELADGQIAVLRVFGEPRPPEHRRGRVLEQYAMPAPVFLAGNDRASLHSFVPGELLGDLIDAGRATPEIWRAVGRAFRTVHSVRFPAGLNGEVQPDRIVLQPHDPVAELHDWIEAATPGFGERLGRLAGHIAQLHSVVDRAAPALRSTSSALGHGDINMWNILVDGDQTTLIDWDYPRICDPAMEIALIDKHASLFNGHGIDPAFFEGYGQAASEPATSIHRVVATLVWATGSDRESFRINPHLPTEQKERTTDWQVTLWAYLERLPEHLARIQAM